ncbi:MAG: tryptophan synthase subunit alpha [Alicyclobacillus sp. RIFOXYA1_FULL_53_8]|nr:MAG: tryptophan synthase subunit alpha [Alicyclobacillus sp. RIFOXYA1_FULL_53_8]
MERLLQAFNNSHKAAALIPFLVAGDPTFDLSLSMFETLVRGPADIVEIGIPYSDPLADGPVIQASALRSLRSNFQLPRAFEMTRELRAKTSKGLVLFTYMNPVYQYTPSRFFADAAEAGADGAIIPDLPFEESALVRAEADKHGVALIPLIAPTSSESRIAAIVEKARGFVYCVAALGVTGERAKMAANVSQLVETARRYTQLPIAVGFGVSSAEQAKQTASFADGVIVGSAFIRRLEQALPASAAEPAEKLTLIDAVDSFAEELASGLTLSSRP